MSKEYESSLSLAKFFREQNPQKIYDELWTEIRRHLPEHKLAEHKVLLPKAFDLAKKAHGEIIRKTGLPYLTHPICVALILAHKKYLDAHLLAAAILHDVVEDSDYTDADLRKKLDDTTADIVDGVTKIVKQSDAMESYNADNLRKIILATAKDVRVMLIKMADRVHNLSSLHIFREEKRERIAKQTLDVFAPIAQKLGLYDFKSELEDAAFYYLDPDFFSYLKRKIVANTQERRKNTRYILHEFEKYLHSVVGIKSQISNISGRAKHYYSIYKKIKSENKVFEDLFDLYGLRIVTRSEEACYKIYEALQKKYKEIPIRFKDYIKEPKPNGYQSLHANFVFEKKVVEVQIRTKEMNYQAESGVATHWKYKQTDRDKKLDKKLGLIRQFIQWQKNAFSRGHTNPELQNDFFREEIIVVTPKGDPIILAEGSTPIDFAYAIHSTIGNRMKAAKVNGSIVQLSHKLTSGDIVEAELSSKPVVSQTWLGLAKQPSTRSKIRKALEIEVEQVNAKKLRQREVSKKESEKKMQNYYQTLDHFATHFKKRKLRVTKCCNPKRTDPIVAFYTKSRKEIVVHRFDCPHQHSLDPSQRVVIEEKKTKPRKVHNVHIVLTDQPGVIIEVLNLFLKAGVSVQKTESKTGKNTIVLTVFTNSDEKNVEKIVSQLSKQEYVQGIKNE